MLYELVTGYPPFQGDTLVAVLSQHVNTPPVAPSWHNADVPRELDGLILRLLAKAPEDRPASAAMVREALAAMSAQVAAPTPAPPAAALNPLDRLAGGVFVGRARELGELRASLEEALAGRGALALLVGEPGIGKTRTAEEFVTYARLRNAQVLWGRCYEGEGAPAYWPWVQVLRSYAEERDAPTLREQMGSGAADIAQVVSEIRERLPELPPPPALASEHARFRLFDAITVFVKNAAKVRPLVLVLDDLHWADKPSLLLLEFMARELRGARVLLLGTYRDVELGRQHPLVHTLGELAREQLSRRVFLRGLTADDVARFIEITAGLTPPAALVAAVYKETEGNPFFVNEVVRLLVSEGRLERRAADAPAWVVDIPQSIREVIGRRLDHLSKECNELLSMAAVIGRDFGHEALERVSELTAERVLDALDEAVAARVIADAPRAPGRYSFAHALIRETLYGELGTGRRVRLHRRIGEVLEGLYRSNPEAHLPELAHHFLLAALGGGDVERAVDYARRAGDRATAQLAHEDAVNHYVRALDALELREVPDEARRCELLLALGGAQARAGDTASAREAFRKAAEPARRMGLPEQLARAALGFGYVGPELRYSGPASSGQGAINDLAQGSINEELVPFLEEALVALPPHDSALRARLLGRLAMALAFARKAAARNRSAARPSRWPSGSATQGPTRRYCRCGTSRASSRETSSKSWRPPRRSLRLAEEAGDQEVALEAHRWRLNHLLELGDVGEADREIEAYEALARRLRQPLYVSFAVALRGMRALMAGRFTEAEALAAKALAVDPRFRSEVKLSLMAQMYWLYREQRRLQDITALAGDLQQAAPAAAAQCGFAALLCDLGMVEEARAQFEQFAANDFSDVPRDFAWLPAMTALVDVCTFLRDAPRAATLYELLLPHTGRNITVVNATLCFGPVAYYLGRLAATMGRHAEAAAHFEQALAMSERMGARPLVAQAKHAYALTLLASGERGRALEVLNQALATARELGMTVLGDQALADARQAQSDDAAQMRD